ncbi:MAG: outer membrane beta-barrel protein, partial [Bacteroidota bacterium]
LPEEREFFFGLSGQPMVSQFWVTEIGLPENVEVTREIGLPAFSFGAYAGEFFSRNWGYEFGVNYTQYVDEASYATSLLDSVSGNTVTNTQTIRQEVQYFTVPLLARFRSNPEKDFQFSAVGGLQVGILSGLNYFVDDIELPDTVRNEFDARSDVYATAQISGQLGAGFSYNFLDNWRVDVRGQAGINLFDIEDIKLKDGTDRGAVRAITAGLFVGLSYRIPRQDDSVSKP